MRLLIIGTLILLNLDSFAQEKKHNKFIFSPGIFFQNHIFIDANIMYEKCIIEREGRFFTMGPKLGFEASIFEGQLLGGGKIGYEFTAFILCGRASTIAYFYNGRTDLKILPEIGFSLLGTSTLTYGYNISILNTKIPELTNHRISLTLNLDKELWGILK